MHIEAEIAFQNVRHEDFIQPRKAQIQNQSQDVFRSAASVRKIVHQTEDQVCQPLGPSTVLVFCIHPLEVYCFPLASYKYQPNSTKAIIIVGIKKCELGVPNLNSHSMFLPCLYFLQLLKEGIVRTKIGTQKFDGAFLIIKSNSMTWYRNEKVGIG